MQGDYEPSHRTPMLNGFPLIRQHRSPFEMSCRDKGPGYYVKLCAWGSVACMMSQDGDGIATKLGKELR